MESKVLSGLLKECHPIRLFSQQLLGERSCLAPGLHMVLGFQVATFISPFCVSVDLRVYLSCFVSEACWYICNVHQQCSLTGSNLSEAFNLSSETDQQFTIPTVYRANCINTQALFGNFELEMKENAPAKKNVSLQTYTNRSLLGYLGLLIECLMFGLEMAEQILDTVGYLWFNCTRT
uniref:Uncharacterized protein n=1 Tax=Megaselia scalaris TaxID=36166 RepID=T1GUK8_MEGSC